jgi:hypothetical protein
MICTNCKDRDHDHCRGGSWCDCQHVRTEAELLAEMGSTGREPNGDDINDPKGYGTMDGEG